MYTNEYPFAGFELAEHLRDCIVPYLSITSEGTPNRVCITTGEIADDECECGEFIISLRTQYESSDFPAPWSGEANQGVRKCGPDLFVYQYDLRVQRCAPQTDTAAAPSCDALGVAAKITVEDAWAVRTGLMCCLCAGVTRDPLTGRKAFERYWVGPQEEVGPAGMCQGSQITVAIGVLNGGYPCGIVAS